MAQIQLQLHDPHTNIDVANSGKRAREFHPFGEDGLTFGDVLDLINPLQHIPLLGGLYRKLAGDAIDPAIRIAGGALFGGLSALRLRQLRWQSVRRVKIWCCVPQSHKQNNDMKCRSNPQRWFRNQDDRWSKPPLPIYPSIRIPLMEKFAPKPGS